MSAEDIESKESKTTEKIVSRKGEVEIKVLNNNMDVYMIVTSPEGDGEEATYEDAVQALKSKKIQYGINDELIKEIFDKDNFDRQILVATGLDPVDGEDGKIRYHIDTERKIKPKRDEKGNVDYKDIGFLQSVRKGQKLAEVIPPKPGIPGKNVFGKKVEPREGKRASLPAGRNTMQSKENPHILIASKEGSISMKGPIVNVEDVYTIESSIDYSTGNIDFVGSLVIKGDVKSGFSVKANGDIDIGGVVEDAYIEGGGNVVLESGTIGGGAGKITSGGDLLLKFSENQTIISKGNVIVGEALIHSHVEADKKVEVSGKKGAIIGGEVIATEGIEAKTVGNYQFTKTEVHVGINEEILKKIKSIEEELVKCDENENNIKKAIYQLVTSGKKLSPDKEALLKKMQRIKSMIPNQRAEIQEEKKKVEKELEKYRDAKISIKGTTYPGVKINIQNKKLSVNEELKGVVFLLENGEVVTTRTSHR